MVVVGLKKMAGDNDDWKLINSEECSQNLI